MAYLFLSTETPSLATDPTTVLREEDDDFNTGQGPNVSVFNYYFLLLAVLAILVAVVILLIHRRRVRQRALWRQSDQQALPRDVESWPHTRRLLHGRYRANNSVLLRQTEGLDEHGQAPPPYQPKTEDTLTIPLRTLPMDESERVQPPEYCDREHNPSIRQEAARP